MDPIPAADAGPPANVLLLHDSQVTPTGCGTLCTCDERTAELRVRFADDGAEPIPDEPAASKLGLLAVGDVIQAAETENGPDFSGEVAVDAVPDPTDLGAIGVSISQFCERWDDEERLVVCFHSLDALFRHAEAKTIFEFTYYLNRRLESVDALAHFHIDPTQHDDAIVAAFVDIFDEVVVDDSSNGTVPEATDDEVASLLADLDGGTDGPDYPWENDQFSEATDEEIEQSLSG